MSYIEFENVLVIAQTDDAALIQFIDEDDEFWIPWSVIENNDENLKNGYEGKIYILEWWASSKGLL